MAPTTISIGDWIRFMHNGKLVIDEIAYVRPRASWEREGKCVTLNHGEVTASSVLEARKLIEEPLVASAAQEGE